MSDEHEEILLSRLSEYGIPRVDPWDVGFEESLVLKGTSIRELPYNPNDYVLWTAEDHAARIRYFMQEPRELDNPIDLDSLCEDGIITCTPVILDGNHRLYARKILACKTVLANFSGRLDLLDYLTGVVNVRPV